MSTDVMRSTLPKGSYDEMAEDLFARFPGVDRAELLRQMVMHYFFEMRFGNKREERAACDFLNEVQARAASLIEKEQKAAKGKEVVK